MKGVRGAQVLRKSSTNLQLDASPEAQGAQYMPMVPPGVLSKGGHPSPPFEDV